MKWREGKKQKYDELIASPEKIIKILEENGKKAREVARNKINKVRAGVGLD
jgi:hypothetical protein